MTAPSDDILQRLLALAAEHFQRDADGLSAGDDLFEALDIDSLQALDLLSRLEEAFDVEIPDYEVQDVRTFGGLADVLRSRL